MQYKFCKRHRKITSILLVHVCNQTLRGGEKEGGEDQRKRHLKVNDCSSHIKGPLFFSRLHCNPLCTIFLFYLPFFLSPLEHHLVDSSCCQLFQIPLLDQMNQLPYIGTNLHPRQMLIDVFSKHQPRTRPRNVAMTS